MWGSSGPKPFVRSIYQCHSWGPLVPSLLWGPSTNMSQLGSTGPKPFVRSIYQCHSWSPLVPSLLWDPSTNITAEAHWTQVFCEVQLPTCHNWGPLVPSLLTYIYCQINQIFGLICDWRIQNYFIYFLFFCFPIATHYFTWICPDCPITML